MTPDRLEQSGSLDQHLFIELLKETVDANLSGSFRLAREREKTIVYLEAGAVAYAASNSRQHRLIECLARWNVLQREDLLEYQTVAPDYKLGEQLVAEERLTAGGWRALHSRQVAEVVAAALLWTNGEWSFSPLVRLREQFGIEIDAPQLLLAAARRLPGDIIIERLKGQNATFAMCARPDQAHSLTSEEAYVMSRIEGVSNFDEIVLGSGLPETTVAPIVYQLWMGDLLRRYNSEGAFGEEKLQQILAAKLTVKKKVEPVLTVAAEGLNGKNTVPIAEEPAAATAEPESTPVAEKTEPSLDLEAFLAQVEKAGNHYETLNVARTAEAREIKTIYLRLVKNFHPDKFHEQAGTPLHTRVQNAFTKVGQAYESLKDAKSRELYDFKLGRTKVGENLNDDLSQLSHQQIFERGRRALERKDYAEAMSFLARAVSLAPREAQYRFSYGQAFAGNPKFYHQAEAEMQTAVQFAPQNIDFRLELAKFYTVIKLPKRAVGELKRLLAIAPGHAEARRLLDSLEGKR